LGRYIRLSKLFHIEKERFGVTQTLEAGQSGLPSETVQADAAALLKAVIRSEIPPACAVIARFALADKKVGEF
jgi:hypothetical protein